MNERIKQLASHCGFNTDAMYAGGFPNDHTIALEDFVKLVVEEVIYVASHIEGIDQIRKHFGIE